MYEEYKNSDEKILEVREWKDRLYAHRMARQRSTESDSDSDGRNRTTMSSTLDLLVCQQRLHFHRAICAA